MTIKRLIAAASMFATFAAAPLPAEGQDVDLRISANSTTLMEGDEVSLTLTRTGPSEGFIYGTLNQVRGTATDRDYLIDEGTPPFPLFMTSGQTEAHLSLRARFDEVPEGDETMTLQASWRLNSDPGGNNDRRTNTLSFTIEDAEPFEITLSAPRTTITEGDSVEVTATANYAIPFDRDDQEYTFRHTGSADVFDFEVDDIVIRAGQKEGSTTLRVIDDGEQEGSETLNLVTRYSSIHTSRQRQSSLTFTIVDADDLPEPPELSITLSGPADPNVTEGASAQLTLTADRAVTEDLTIEVRRAADSTAGWDDINIDPNPIVMRSGQTEATTMLTAVEDEEDERDETLILRGRWGTPSRSTDDLTLTIWDAAVPALPVVAALLLAAALWHIGRRRMARGR